MLFFCGSTNVVHNGLRGRIQRYKCNDCGRRFDGAQVIIDYIEGKQTPEQLANKYQVSARTIAWAPAGDSRKAHRPEMTT